MSVIVREKIKGSGTWWLFVNHDGKRGSKKIGTDKREANRLGKLLQTTLNAGDLGFLEDKKTAGSLNYYITLWLSGSAKVTLKPSTVDGYNSLHRKHIRSSIGKRPVDEISELDMENFLLDKLKKLSHSSVTHIRNCASGGFKTAKKDKAITANPCHGFVIGSKEDMSRKPKVEPLNSSELMQLLETYSVHRPDHLALIMVLGFAGLRIGEAVALKWKDLHFKGRYIHVQRSYRLITYYLFMLFHTVMVPRVWEICTILHPSRTLMGERNSALYLKPRMQDFK